METWFLTGPGIKVCLPPLGGVFSSIHTYSHTCTHTDIIYVPPVSGYSRWLTFTIVLLCLFSGYQTCFTCWQRADASHSRNESFTLFTSFEYKHLPAKNWPPDENGFMILTIALDGPFWKLYQFALLYIFLFFSTSFSLKLLFKLFFITEYAKEYVFPFPPFFLMLSWLDSASPSTPKLYRTHS
jgi:hypothetical protein